MSERKKPYPCKIEDGTDCVLVRTRQEVIDLLMEDPSRIGRVGMIALSMFRLRPEMDYIGIGIVEIDAEEHWQRVFGIENEVDWMAGIANPYSRERVEDLNRVHRNNKSFRQIYGWNPDLIIEDVPTELEVEAYTEHLIGDALEDDEHLHADLNKALSDEF